MTKEYNFFNMVLFLDKKQRLYSISGTAFEGFCFSRNY